MQNDGHHEQMIETLRRYGIRSRPILDAMRKVRRDEFIPRGADSGVDPYGDHPCSIGHGQTISQPYIVAYMTERLDLRPGERVLEVGTGSGYQTAVLAELGLEVYTVERIAALAEHARAALDHEGYKGVHARIGDGYDGWNEESPFDAIIVTCAPTVMPGRLIEQLGPKGRMIVPIGADAQRLVLIRKKNGIIEEETDIGVRFVPMVRDGDRTA